MTGTARTLGAFVRRDWAIERSYRFAFAFELLDSVLYIAIFYYIGGVVGASDLARGPEIDGDYFGFVVVGLALLAVLSAGLTAVSDRIRTDQLTGTLEVLLAMSPSHFVVALGGSIYPMLRSLAEGSLLLLIGVTVFGLSLDLDWFAPLLALYVVGCSVAIFTAIGVALASLTMIVKQVGSFRGLLVQVMAIGSGVYFPITVLPDGVEGLARLSPLTWGADGMRAALLDRPTPVSELVALGATAVAAVPIAATLLRAAVARARRTGSLSEY